MSLGHPQPLRGFDYIGFHYYSLTWCCKDRKPQFAQADRVALVLRQFLRAGAEAEIELSAYCFMPDHVHQVVKGTSPTSDGRRYIKLAKQYAGFYFSQTYGETPFQRYGHDRWLRKDGQIRRTIRYVIENPVRAGIVESIEDYPYTGSQVYTIEQLKEWAYR
jgi:putative transposase